MVNSKTSLSRPVAVHQCPVCHQPQTKIQRRLSDDRHGSTSFVCTRTECVVGVNLTQVATWVAV